MNADYTLRIACLGLAVFFLAHLGCGLAISLAAGPIVRLLARQRARFAARVTFALRMLPATGALFLVAVFCVPSYLRFEPDADQESIGLFCIAAALAGLSILSLAWIRAVRATLQSARLVRDCRMNGHETRGASPILVVKDSSRLVALIGLTNPRIVVSAGAIGKLSISQLSAAIRHERAHHESRDNLKRLMLLLAPDLIPGWSGFDRLNASWRRFTEWAADDRACGGRASRSLALADALVRMARLSASTRAASLATSLLAEDQELPTRVERLLRNAPPAAPWNLSVRLCSAAVILFALCAVITIGLGGHETIYGLLETLID